MPASQAWGPQHDPIDGIHRRCTWIGETTRVVVTGLPAGFIANAPPLVCVDAWHRSPCSAVCRALCDSDGFALARQLEGVLFTMLLAQNPKRLKCSEVLVGGRQR